MKRIESIEELKEIQLDLLLALHQFCCEHGINYSLAAGSLIGAVRHKGFIPWDDDIDVYLLREDYNKLIDLCPPVLEDKYVLLSRELDKKWHRAYAKFYDNRTIMVESTRNKYEGMGVGIDVFPIDDVPDDQREWKKYNKKRIFIRNVAAIKSLAFSKKRNPLKSVFSLLGQLMLAPISFETIAEIMDKYSQKNNGKGYGHVYENCLGVYNSEYAWLKEDLKEVIDVSFEGHQVKMMAGYDDYLTKVYGDYMTLPSKEKRVTHHMFEAYWKSL